jgi:hypothetical protein
MARIHSIEPAFWSNHRLASDLTRDRRLSYIGLWNEAEAMPAGTMRALLREYIEAFLPADAIATTRAAEESERSLIGWAADQLERAS